MATTLDLLMPYQSKWIAETHQICIAEKSRQIGFTFGTAPWAVLEAIKERGRNTYYVGYNKAMSSQFIADVAFWADAFNSSIADIRGEKSIFVKGKREFSIFRYKVEFANGHFVESLSSHPENIRSKRGNIIIDEAAFHKDLDPIITASLALNTWGGRILIISTHYGDTNPFAQLVADARAGKFNARVHRVNFRQAVEQGLYQRIAMQENLDRSPEAEAAWVQHIYHTYGDRAAEELDVIPSRGGDAYIPAQMIERCMVRDLEVIRLSLDDGFAMRVDYEKEHEIINWFSVVLAPKLGRLPQHLRHFVGLDFGRSVDKTAIVVLTEEPNMDHTCSVVVELHNVPFDEQWLLLDMLIAATPRLEYVAMDARGNGQALAEKASLKYYEKVEAVYATDRYYIAHMPKLKAKFEDATITIPQHTDILQDLRSISVVKGVPKIPDNKRRNGTDGLTRHGDVAMALFYGVCAASQSSPAPASASVDVPMSAYRIPGPRGRRWGI